MSVPFLIVVASILMLFMSLATLLIFNISRKKILEEQAINQQKEIDFQEQMLRANLEVQEEERKRIARELHDEIGSKLNVVKLNTNLLKTALAQGEDTSELFDHIGVSLKDSIRRAREISHDLMPPTLVKFGVRSALNSFAHEIRRTGVVNFELDIDHDWGFNENIDELHLFRVFQELVSNTLKHAEATTIKIKSDMEGGVLKLVYEDDGKGIKNTENGSVGLGMHNIATRIKLLKAEYKLHELDKGFKIEILRKT